MAGVYGEFLGFFPELMEEFKVYKMKPLVGAGYDKVLSRIITALRQTADASLSARSGYNRKVEASGMESRIVSEVEGIVLWSTGELSLKDEFVEVDDEMYRPIGRAKFIKEGGYWRTELRKVVGNQGDEEPLVIKKEVW